MAKNKNLHLLHSIPNLLSLRYFHTVHQVFIEPAIIQKAKEFAIQVTATTNYADSNQLSAIKINNDHFISKIGEEAAKLVLSKYAQVNGPDYTIYHGKAKSWNDDLYVNNIGLAVKTQKRSMAQKFGLSWTFQSGPNRCDIILKKTEAWVVFVEYDDISGNVCYVYPPFRMKELTLGEPVLKKLKGFKKVVYANTLPLHKQLYKK
jgi:hypothetical protein